MPPTTAVNSKMVIFKLIYRFLNGCRDGIDLNVATLDLPVVGFAKVLKKAYAAAAYCGSFLVQDIRVRAVKAFTCSEAINSY